MDNILKTPLVIRPLFAPPGSYDVLYKGELVGTLYNEALARAVGALSKLIDALEETVNTGNIPCLGDHVGVKIRTALAEALGPQSISMDKVRSLRPGLYRIIWMEGHTSLAAIGFDNKDHPWYAIAGGCVDGVERNWQEIASVEEIPA